MSSADNFIISKAFTKEDYIQAKELTKRAFWDYKLFMWVSKFKPQDPQALPSVVSFMCDFISVLSAPPKGTVLLCHRKSDNRLVGAATLTTETATSTNRFVAALQRFVRQASVAMLIIPMLSNSPFKVFSSDPIDKEGMRRFQAMQYLEVPRQKHLCHRDYLYLMQLACEPDCQRQGVGQALLKEIQKMADERQIPCWLETDEPHLAAFYEHVAGFKLVEEYVLCEGTIDPFFPNFGMLREPVKKA